MMILLRSLFGLFVTFVLAGYFFASVGIYKLMENAGMGRRGLAYVPLYRLWILGELTGQERYLPAAFLICGGFPVLMFLLCVCCLVMLLTVFLSPLALVLALLLALLFPVALYACPMFFNILLYRFFKERCERFTVVLTVLSVIFTYFGIWQYLVYFVSVAGNANTEDSKKSPKEEKLSV